MGFGRGGAALTEITPGSVHMLFNIHVNVAFWKAETLFPEMIYVKWSSLVKIDSDCTRQPVGFVFMELLAETIFWKSWLTSSNTI